MFPWTTCCLLALVHLPVSLYYCSFAKSNFTFPAPFLSTYSFLRPSTETTLPDHHSLLICSPVVILQPRSFLLSAAYCRCPILALSLSSHGDPFHFPWWFRLENMSSYPSLRCCQDSVYSIPVRTSLCPLSSLHGLKYSQDLNNWLRPLLYLSPDACSELHTLVLVIILGMTILRYS